MDLDRLPIAGGDERERDGMRGAPAAIALVIILLLVVWWWFSRTARVPDVIGMTDERARAAISAAGFVVGDVTIDTAEPDKAGTIVDQDPYGGSRKLRGSAIEMVLEARPGGAAADGTEGEGLEPEVPVDLSIEYGESGGAKDPYSPRTVSGPQVPQVFGLTQAEARARLESAGYRLGAVEHGPSTTGVAENTVFHQDPAPETYAARGTVVDVWLSIGPPGGFPYPKP